MEKTIRNQDKISLPLLTSLCLISRLIFAGKYLEGWDDVDFALSLHDYDLSSYQPHFPGYFFYIAFGRIFSLMVDNDVLALVLPNALFGSISVIPLYFLASQLFSKPTANITILLYIINPLYWLQSERPLSDVSALFFIIMFAHLMIYSIKNRSFSTWYSILGSLTLGIALGIKPAYFPFVITWIALLWLQFQVAYFDKTELFNKKAKYFVILSMISFIAGLSTWLVPLLTLVGINNFLAEGCNFIVGHFTEWGGSIYTQSNIIDRLKAAYRSIFVNGFGFLWSNFNLTGLILTITIITLIGFYSFKVLKSIFLQKPYILTNIQKKIKIPKNDFGHFIRKFTILISNPIWSNIYFLIVFISPYFIWVFFCQNINNPRHALPLIPFIIILISASLSYLNLGKALKIIVVSVMYICYCSISVNTLLTFKHQLPMQLQLINYVKANFDKNSTRIYCGETKRLFEYYAPSWDVRMVRSVNDLKFDIKSSLINPELILSTSNIKGVENSDGFIFLTQFSQHRYINDSYSKLCLYKFNKKKIEISRVINNLN